MVSEALVQRWMVLTRGGELEVLMRTPWLWSFRLFSCDVLVYSFCVLACGLECSLIRSELAEKEKSWLVP
jgi:hypothetical protein